MPSSKHINWIKTGMFEMPVFFSCGFTKDIWTENNFGFVCKRTFNDKEYYFLILKERFIFKDENYSKLAHEVLHLSSYILNDHAINLYEENECFAYLHTYIMNQILRVLRS